MAGSNAAEVIERQCGAMGATFSFVVRGGREAAFKVLELSEFETSGEDARERAWKIKAVLEAVK